MSTEFSALPGAYLFLLFLRMEDTPLATLATRALVLSADILATLVFHVQVVLEAVLPLRALRKLWRGFLHVPVCAFFVVFYITLILFGLQLCWSKLIVPMLLWIRDVLTEGPPLHNFALLLIWDA